MAQRTTVEGLAFLQQTEFLLDHLFEALDHYARAEQAIQARIAHIDRTAKVLSDVFVDREQWSVAANHHYGVYMERMKTLQQQKVKLADVQVLEAELVALGASTEALAMTAGAVLQVAKQALSYRHGGRGAVIGACQQARTVGHLNISTLIWEGRNHGMHWEDQRPPPDQRIPNMLTDLGAHLGRTLQLAENNSLTIVRALGWTCASDVFADLKPVM